MEPSTDHLLQTIDFAYIGYIDDLLKWRKFREPSKCILVNRGN